jgi:hypothetical protein
MAPSLTLRSGLILLATLVTGLVVRGCGWVPASAPVKATAPRESSTKNFPDE